MPKAWSPPFSIGLLAGLATWLLLAVTISYQTHAAWQQLDATASNYQLQICRNLSYQISRAWEAHDDLTALAVLRNARTLHPQLHLLEVFDATGKIILHTEANAMGKTTKPYTGPELGSPDICYQSLEGKTYRVILASIPDQPGLYSRAYFDQTNLRQPLRLAWIRQMVLAGLEAGLLGLLLYTLLKFYEWTDPRKPVRLPLTEESEPCLTQPRIMELLLPQLRSAALLLSRNNHVVAANPLALQTLHREWKELSNQHLLQAPFTPDFKSFYQMAIQTPGKKSQCLLLLDPGHSASVSATLICLPATPDWELALITWS